MSSLFICTKCKKETKKIVVLNYGKNGNSYFCKKCFKEWLSKNKVAPKELVSISWDFRKEGELDK